jgi:hypothetical protein
MTEIEFWKVIAAANGDVGAVRRALLGLPAGEIAAFDELCAKKRIEAYRWPLWGAAHLLNGGCSDDGFEHFRGWLIAQGREVFEAALKDPDATLAKYAGENELELEELLSVACRAYEEKTGSELTVRVAAFPQEPAGERWSEGDLPRLFPKIAAAKRSSEA